MTRAWDESAVSLDKLDDHLKALLRLKIREFVHLSPWFKDVPVVDSSTFVPSCVRAAEAMSKARMAACPHRKNDGKIGRRIVRGSLHLNGVFK